MKQIRSKIRTINKLFLTGCLLLICIQLSERLALATDDQNIDGVDIEDLASEQHSNDDSSMPTSDGETKPNPKNKEYISPKLKPDNLYLFENFDSEQLFKTNWIQSKDPKYEGKWQLNSGADRPHADKQLLLPSKARHYAISTKLIKPFKFGEVDKPLVVQYEVQFREGLDCGGAYVKLLRQSASNDLTKVTDKTPFTIMFGPDKCGSESKLHFIINYPNPKTQDHQEKHWKQAKFVTDLMSTFSDKRHHLYRLLLESNNNFELFLDDKSVGKGNLLDDMDPAINPPKEIVDPNDVKPLDWDDRAQIDDPDAKKPDDWNENAPKEISDPDAVKPEDWLENEPKYIPDPEATKPEDWEDMDGEWEAPKIENPACKDVSGCGEWVAPLIPNPEYKGKWKTPKIDNPNYKGKWSPKMIPNPDYFFDDSPFKSLDTIGAITYELWSMADNVAFDNLIITDDHDSASLLQFLTWQSKKAEADASSPSWIVRSMHYLKTYPWLWGVLVVSIALPLFLFIAYCCDTKSSNDKGRKKKTDEASPDTIREKIVEEEESEGEEKEQEDEEEDQEEEDDDEESAEAGDKASGDDVARTKLRQRKN